MLGKLDTIFFTIQVINQSSLLKVIILTNRETCQEIETTPTQNLNTYPLYLVWHKARMIFIGHTLNITTVQDMINSLFSIIF